MARVEAYQRVHNANCHKVAKSGDVVATGMLMSIEVDVDVLKTNVSWMRPDVNDGNGWWGSSSLVSFPFCCLGTLSTVTAPDILSIDLEKTTRIRVFRT